MKKIYILKNKQNYGQKIKKTFDIRIMNEKLIFLILTIIDVKWHKQYLYEKKLRILIKQLNEKKFCFQNNCFIKYLQIFNSIKFSMNLKIRYFPL